MRRLVSKALPFAFAIGAMGCLQCTLSCRQVESWAAFDVLMEEDALRESPLEATPRIDFSSTVEFPQEGPIELSVEQAVLAAIHNNRDLHVQRFNPVIAESFEQIERGVFDPELFARVQYFEQEATEVSRATSENFSSEVRETLAEAGVRQTLPTGTDVEVGVSTNRSASNRAPEQQVARVGITVTQALLRGFGPAVRRASVRQAELETAATRYQLQAFTEAVIAETESTYWLYALAARRIAIYEESMEVARRQQQEVDDRIEIGVLPETERAFANAEVAQREQDLIDARAELDVLRFQLLRLINPAESGRLDREVTASSGPQTDAAPLDDVDDRIQLAILARPEVNEARLRLEQNRLETIVTRNGLLPRLDFFLALGKTGYADELSESFRQIGEDSTFDLTAGLEFSYPLGNRTATGQHQAALANRAQAAAAIENLEQLVRRDVLIAAVEVERSREQIIASGVTRALREEALRAEQERLRVGDSTALLVAQTQRDLIESQIAEVDAIVAYRLALIDLYLAEGTLLSRRGLLIE